jgi:hypothetical protein
MSAGTATPEFSRIVTLDATTQPLIRLAIDAKPGECAALARRFGLEAITALRLDGELRAADSGMWRLAARVTSDVVQTCVVSLEPLPAHVDERFEIVFSDDGAAASGATELDIALDDAEPLPADGRLDVGEIAAQQLLLALEPFPRKAGEVVPRTGDDEDGHRPFAGLAARLARRDEPGGA